MKEAIERATQNSRKRDGIINADQEALQAYRDLQKQKTKAANYQEYVDNESDPWARALGNVISGFKNRGVKKKEAELEPQIMQYKSNLARAIEATSGGNVQIDENNFYPETLEALYQKQVEENIAPSSLNKTPSAFREWELYNQLPEDQQANYMNLKRADPFAKQGLQKTDEGALKPIAGYQESVGQIEGEKARSKEEGKIAAKKTATFPKARSALINFNRKSGFVMDAIERAMPLINNLTAGYGGKPLSAIPGLEGQNVRSLVLEIKSNLGFNELQKISETGGTLGQVTEKELEFLQSTNGNLNIEQTPEFILETLTQLQERMPLFAVDMEDAFRYEYADILGIERPEPMPDIEDLGERLTPPQAAPQSSSTPALVYDAATGKLVPQGGAEKTAPQPTPVLIYDAATGKLVPQGGQ